MTLQFQLNQTLVIGKKKKKKAIRSPQKMSHLSLSFSMTNTYMTITGNTSFLLKHAFGTLQGKCYAVMDTAGLFHIPETLSLHCF